MLKKAKKGFTIVELVIVIAVIAILAAVLIPTFTNVVENANKSAALSTAKNAHTTFIAETMTDSGYESDAQIVFVIGGTGSGSGYTVTYDNGEYTTAKTTTTDTYTSATKYTIEGYDGVDVYVTWTKGGLSSDFSSDYVKKVESTDSSTEGDGSGDGGSDSGT